MYMPKQKHHSTTFATPNRATKPFFTPVGSQYPQAKLSIGKPGDRYEQEADNMADQVMNMSAPGAAVSHAERHNPSPVSPAVQRQAEPEKEEEEKPLQAKPLDSVLQRQGMEEKEEEEEPIQTKPQGGTATVSAATSSRVQSLRQGGEPLPAATRHFFESRMGRDFGDVRVHTDSRATETARAVQAKAYTLDNNIVFNNGQYAPDSQAGRHLLAHELTHVLQQRPNTKDATRKE